MPYRFSRERLDYSDFASGRVIRSVPGRTAFPVRLADELFQRCLALRPAAIQDRPVTLYDPCCGGASLLCTLALLHWPSIRAIVASDADPDALTLAGRNLALLTLAGMDERRQEIAALHAAYDKASHAEALGSVERLSERLGDALQIHPLPTRHFLADSLDAASLRANLDAGSIDMVIADLPYGQRSRWLDGAPDPAGAAAGPDEGAPAVWRLLDALWPILAADAVLAIVTDKSQRARHERYVPAGTLQIGKRRATFLTVRPRASVTLAPLSEEERATFTTAQVADYAAWLVERGDAAHHEAALIRARAEIEPEMAAAFETGDRFWSAHDPTGKTVGWLWVQTVQNSPVPGAAFLYQILVQPEARRQGNGLAMLEALEAVLARAGWSELRLNVWDSNVAGRRLYARAGYEAVERFPLKRQLRKRLAPRAAHPQDTAVG